jgi:hypothetical protein
MEQKFEAIFTVVRQQVQELQAKFDLMASEVNKVVRNIDGLRWLSEQMDSRDGTDHFPR